MIKIVVPSLWKVMRCAKHEDYVKDCPLCEEEVLTIKTDNAYRAGFKAAQRQGKGSD